MEREIRKAAKEAGIDELGPASVTDGSRAKQGGYKNSLHLVFHQSRPCRPPTSASNDPTYPPLVAGRRVHQALPDVQDEKGARQPDLGVYTSRRNMRMIGSCKTGQLVPLVPVDVASPNGGFNKTLWADWLRSHEPNDLLEFMISQDDGSEPNWYLHSPLVVWSACADRCSGRRSEQEASGTSRARPGALLLSPDSSSSSTHVAASATFGSGDHDNWEALGAPVCGQATQDAAGGGGTTAKRPALQAWATTDNDDADADADDGAGSFRMFPDAASGASAGGDDGSSDGGDRRRVHRRGRSDRRDSKSRRRSHRPARSRRTPSPDFDDDVSSDDGRSRRSHRQSHSSGRRSSRAVSDDRKRRSRGRRSSSPGRRSGGGSSSSRRHKSSSSRSSASGGGSKRSRGRSDGQHRSMMRQALVRLSSPTFALSRRRPSSPPAHRTETTAQAAGARAAAAAAEPTARCALPFAQPAAAGALRPGVAYSRCRSSMTTNTSSRRYGGSSST